MLRSPHTMACKRYSGHSSFFNLYWFNITERHCLLSIVDVVGRMVIRHIVDKAIRKVVSLVENVLFTLNILNTISFQGVAILEPLFPEADRALLHYVDRSIRRRRLHAKRIAVEENEDESFNVENRIATKTRRKVVPDPRNQHADSDLEISTDDDDDFFNDPTSHGQNPQGHQMNQAMSSTSNPFNIQALLDELEAESDSEHGISRRGVSVLLFGTFHVT